MRTKQPSEIEYRQTRRLRPEVKARLEALDEYRTRFAYAGISTWTTYEAGEEWDTPCVRFYVGRRLPFAEWNAENGKATSLGEEPPFTFRAKNVRVILGRMLQMSRRLAAKLFPDHGKEQREGQATPQGCGARKEPSQGA